MVKSRWVCLPLDFRFYMMQKDIEAKSINAIRTGKLLSFESKMKQAATMLKEVHRCFQLPVLIVADSWFGNDGLWSRLARGTDGCFHLLTRMRTNITLYDFAPVFVVDAKRKDGRPRKYGDRLGNVNDCTIRWKEKAQSYTVSLYGKKREVRAYSQVVMLKTMKCPVRIIWVYRQTRYVALMTTDLTLSIKQIIEYYGARWKIESGFKEIKQEIGSSKSQARNADAVINHLNFCMMATTLTWMYADRLQTAPDRRYKIRGRSSFGVCAYLHFLMYEELLRKQHCTKISIGFAHFQRKDHKNLSSKSCYAW